MFEDRAARLADKLTDAVTPVIDQVLADNELLRQHARRLIAERDAARAETERLRQQVQALTEAAPRALREAARRLTDKVVVTPHAPEDERARNRARLDVADELDAMAQALAATTRHTTPTAEETASGQAHAAVSEPLCNCGHTRAQHQGAEGLGGAQCLACPGDTERTWRHPYTPAPHSCRNCEGIDPGTCLTNPNRTAEEA